MLGLSVGRDRRRESSAPRTRPSSGSRWIWRASQPSEGAAIPRILSTLALIVVLFALVACNGAASQAPTRPDSTSKPNATATATIASPTVGQANVITGRVTTEPGDPIAAAQVRIVGYTGGASLGREIETVESGADGAYRYDVPNGLYEVLGKGTIAFEGQSYMFDLEPADGSCDQQMSDDGIVKDLVLRLTGLKSCRRDPLPDNYLSYNGAAIQLSNGLSDGHSQDAMIEYTLTPIGSLADGSTGQTLTMDRTVAGLRTSAGPIDRTWILFDIPLAKYRVTATILEPGGRQTPLFVSTLTDQTPTTEVDVTFDNRKLFGDTTVGYAVPQLRVHDSTSG